MKTGWGILGTGLLLAATLGTVGCSFVCPASGYASIITVNVEGNAAAVDEVQMCSDQGCSQRLPDYAPAIPMKTVQPGVPGSDTPTPFIPATPPAAFLGTRTDIDTWAFSISQADLPEHVTVRALGADKAVLAEQRNDLVWTRVGGSEQCGGPVTTPPIILRVP
ncbi:hypothetical protein [Pseudarthrobacter sp. BRE9]|uniref:hypothetical protein n=1 Tax=Pseudarthrobacter sp. BRE9 TaxID=2962582 RepID=UPI002881ACCC|nr:hypothetical protein [Pseudarthrobacter sp. BRE9]MDT0168896.1 hypothetical protein [Pseudarthrobacter sp. BRE9]